MDRKTEIKKDIFDIMKNVYSFHEAQEPTVKQTEFLNKTMDYLESEISLRRIPKEVKPEKKTKAVVTSQDIKCGICSGKHVTKDCDK